MADVDMQSGSDDSMEDFDEAIREVKEKLKDDDRNIPAANRLLDLLRRNGDFDELEAKRKQFVEWAPLTANNWINWIKDTIAKESPSKATVENMFEKALFDENDVAIWIERMYYAQTIDFQYLQQTSEKALTAVGGRYDAGGHIWLLYLDNERKHLIEMLESDDSPNCQPQISRLVNLFQRSLRCATNQLEELFEAANNFCEETDQNQHKPEMKKHFDSTMKLKAKLEPIEAIIDNPRTKKQGLKQFFEFEQKSKEPARVQMAHERMVAELDDDETVWSAYGVWTETELRLPNVSVTVYERALRHCPYSHVLHQQALLALERARRPVEQIDALWEKAKQNCVSSPEDGRNLYRTYGFLIRRRLSLAGSKDFSPVAEILDEGAAILREWFSMAWDPTTEYRQMQAYFYASRMNDMTRCRSIWTDILASGSGRFAGKWLEIARIERQFGDKEHARKWLSKALNSVSDNVNEIYSYFVQFEREEGTLAELETVLEKVNSQVAHRAARPQRKPTAAPPSQSQPQAAQPTASSSVSKRAVGGEPIVKKVKQEDGGFKAPLPPAQKKASAAPSSASSAPKPAASSGDGDEKRTVFVSNLEYGTSEDDIRQAISGVESIRFGKNNGFAFVVLEDEAKVRNALAKDRVPVKGRPMFISENNPEKRVGFKYSTGIEKSKVFVRNLHFQATEDELKELFSKFGTVKSVRRVTHRDGKPKGVAFVEFSAEDEAQKCVESGEKLMLRERELSVAISDPPRKTDTPKGAAAKKAEEPDEGARKPAKLLLVPRAIAAKSSAHPPQITGRLEDIMDTSGPAPSTSIAPKSLSNDQFRQFLMKK